MKNKSNIFKRFVKYIMFDYSRQIVDTILGFILIMLFIYNGSYFSTPICVLLDIVEVVIFVYLGLKFNKWAKENILNKPDDEKHNEQDFIEKE